MTYSRITGTGGYLPDTVLTNKDLEALVDTNDEWIVSRTGIRERHIAADGQSTSDLALRGLRAARSPPRAARPRTSTSSCSRTSTPDMVFPVERLPAAGEARRDAGRGLRRAGGVHRVRLRARHRGPVHTLGPAHAARSSSAPKCSRASSTGRTAAPACSSATAPAPWCWRLPTSPGILSSELHADGRYADILNVPGHVCRRHGAGRSHAQDGRRRRLQARGARARGERALDPRGQRHGRAGPRRLHSPPGQRAHHLPRREEAGAARIEVHRDGRPPRQHLRRLDPARARRRRARRAHQAWPARCCCRA